MGWVGGGRRILELVVKMIRSLPGEKGEGIPGRGNSRSKGTEERKGIESSKKRNSVSQVRESVARDVVRR